MTKASDNQFPSVVLEEVANDGSATGTPAADHRRLFLGEDGALHLKDSAAAVTTVGGLADQGVITYLDATEAAAPATPASGKVRIYAKTDGRIYSKDDAGTQYGPFDEAGGGGADLSNFRLSGVADDPDDIALGTYGDEFEYETASDFTTAGWTATGSLTDYRLTGSGVAFCSANTSGRGFYLDIGGNLPDNFEIAVLLSDIGQRANMCGVGILDSSGNGVGFSMYDSAQGADMWTVASYAYSSTLAQNTSDYLSADQSHAPHWLAIRRSSATTWRTRFSTNGSSWTTGQASQSATVTNARRIFIGSFYNAAGDYQRPVIHRLVYGTSDLGL